MHSSDPTSAPPRTILTPSTLNRLVRGLLEDALPLVWIEGELCNVSRPASGHLYFTLKDAGAQVRAAMFKPKSNWLRFKPVDGMQVLVRARVGLYEPRGEYQLVAEHMEQAGEGALRRQFELLKARLDAEGLFDAGRKRARPIVMTTVAMAAGMVPSALALGEGGSFRAPMAIAVIGGLLASTLLSLVFVPAVFTIMDDLSRLFGWIFGRFVGPKDEPETGPRALPRETLRAAE